MTGGGIRKRSVSLNGHRTSYSLEDAFQRELERIAARRAMPLARLVAEIDAVPRREGGLSSALRLHVLDALREEAGRAGEPDASPPITSG